MVRTLLIPIAAVLFLVAAAATPADGQEFLRGDVNNDGIVDPLLDTFALLDYGFGGGPTPECLDGADVDNNGTLFPIIDSLALLNWAFGDGAEIPDPGTEECGEDPGGGDLGCDTEPDPCPGDEPDLTADPDYQLEISDETGVVGEETTVTVSLTTADDSVLGIQFSVCHDDSVSMGEDDAEIGVDADGEDYTFSSVVSSSDGWTLALLLNVISSATIDEVEDYELATATYSVDSGGTADIEFCDTVGIGVPTRVLIDGELVLPETENGSIEVVAGDEDYVLMQSSEEGSVGSSADVVTSLTNDGDDIEGYQFSVCHTEEAELEDAGSIAVGEDLDTDELLFHSVNAAEEYWTVGAVFDFEEGQVLEPGDDLELYVTTYELLETGTAEITFCTEDLDPATISVVVAGEAILPVTEDGSIEIVESLERAFLRGDADNDGEVFPLLDSIFILRWGFLSAEAPGCMDAVDMDDDGEVIPILEAIALLDYAFNDGDAPVDPGPTDCGEDPTDDDDFDCEETSDFCS